VQPEGEQRIPELVSTVEIYDPATDSWTRGSDMPTARAGLSTSVVNGKIYAIGGDVQFLIGSSGSPFLEIYDPTTDGWTKGSDMLTARMGLSTSVVDGKIHAIGGEGGAGINVNSLATVERYTPIIIPAALQHDKGLTTTWGDIRRGQ